MSVRICNFPKPDGSTCASPALRGKKLCYFHQRDHKRRQYAAGVIRRADVLGPRLPRMKSLYDVQVAISEVLHAMADQRLSTQRAGRILFDIQQATIPLRTPRRSRI